MGGSLLLMEQILQRIRTILRGLLIDFTIMTDLHNESMKAASFGAGAKEQRGDLPLRISTSQRG
jgi:hypothetical protein